MRILSSEATKPRIPGITSNNLFAAARYETAANEFHQQAAMGRQIFGSTYQVPFDLDTAGVLDEDHRNPALRSGLHGLQRPCAWQSSYGQLHEIERRVKETPEDVRLGLRQDLALPILELAPGATARKQP
jgi:hypothetical protein